MPRQRESFRRSAIPILLPVDKNQPNLESTCVSKGFRSIANAYSIMLFSYLSRESFEFSVPRARWFVMQIAALVQRSRRISINPIARNIEI